MSVLLPQLDGFVEGHFCDHNCTRDVGNYDCPAAFTRNKNIIRGTTMSLEQLSMALEKAKAGLVEANNRFLEQSFDDYAQEYHVPHEVAAEIKTSLAQGEVEVNLFGGNPELHPHFLDILPVARRMGWKVTATTTGKKFLHDGEFYQRFVACPPDLLACSADDFESVDELKRLIDMDLADLKKYWQKANPLYGQRKKAYESVYLAKLTHSRDFCPLLFNIVVHPGNLRSIGEILSLLKTHFPKALVNPYPAQASFEYSDVDWEEGDVPILEEFVDLMIERQIAQADGPATDYVPRLPYWLALKSVFLTATSRREIRSLLSGNGIWRCYSRAGSGRYLQASCASKTQATTFSVGGHPGCFWNHETVTNGGQQLWDMDADAIARHILIDKPVLAKRTGRPCPGCIMPRLMFDGVAIELGLDSRLLPAYLDLRNRYFHF
jgi:organic radical activating enzyme